MSSRRATSTTRQAAPLAGCSSWPSQYRLDRVGGGWAAGYTTNSCRTFASCRPGQPTTLGVGSSKPASTTRRPSAERTTLVAAICAVPFISSEQGGGAGEEPVGEGGVSRTDFLLALRTRERRMAVKRERKGGRRERNRGLIDDSVAPSPTARGQRFPVLGRKQDQARPASSPLPILCLANSLLIICC